MKNTILTLSALLLISCSAIKFIPPAPTQSDADRIKGAYPELTVAELNEGKLHFEAHCGKCHGYKNPKKYSEVKLKTTVPRMVVKANKKAGKEVINPVVQESILKYVLAMRGANG